MTTPKSVSKKTSATKAASKAVEVKTFTLPFEGTICKQDYKAELVCSEKTGGVIIHLDYNDQEFVISETAILAHLLERGVTRNTQDNNKSVEDAVRYLRVNEEGYLSPAKKEQALRPQPLKASGGKRGRPSSKMDRSALETFFDLNAQQEHLASLDNIQKMDDETFSLVMASDKKPGWLADLLEAYNVEQQEKAQKAQEEAETEALALLS